MSYESFMANRFQVHFFSTIVFAVSERNFTMDKCYVIKSPAELQLSEIDLITEAWQIPEFKSLSNDEFIQRFNRSEFHLFYVENELVAVARINFDFNLEIEERKHNF